MDVEKLIHCLQCCARVDAHNIGCDDCGLEYCGPECQQLCGTAATALSTLQAENKRLNKIVCSIPTTPDSGRTVSQYDKEMSMCAYLDDLEAENEKLRAELEQVIAERDAAVSWAQKYTESIDMPCVACKHNTGDYVCTAICGNCGPMGAESCKWEFDFSGELKED